MNKKKSLILCEKPSVARETAKGTGEVFKQHDGYLESNNYIVTWAYGHLFELKEPEQYNPELKVWRMKDLPIFPERFEYKVTESGKKQFEVIKRLIHRPDIWRVIVNTDPGREGELIARIILKEAGNKKPVFRLWTSEALTSEVIKRELGRLKPSSEFDRVYKAAVARQWADWIVGINASRAVSLRLKGLYPVGRVQTPLLAIVVQREKEIENFVPKKYYTVVGEFISEEGSIYSGLLIANEQPGSTDTERSEEDAQEDSTTGGINSRYAILSAEFAQAVTEAVKGKSGFIKSIEEKVVYEQPPLLFSLTTLQQEASKYFGLTAEQTLQVAQSLYEKHLISYPRTESQYLPLNIADKASDLIRRLASVEELVFNQEMCRVTTKNKRVFNPEGVQDHFAIIPQRVPQTMTSLAEQERKLYLMICKRFIAAFCPDCKATLTKAKTVVTDEYVFETKGKRINQLGWREIYNYGATKDGENLLPPLKKDQAVIVKDCTVKEGQTKPPPRYTDASLIWAMANAHRFVENEEIKRKLRETSGIGTPATRSQIIENLVKRGYLVRRGKYYIPTEKAFILVESLRDERVASVGYTALWEQELERIASGGVPGVENFLRSIKEYTKHFVEHVVPRLNVDCKAEVHKKVCKAFVSKADNQRRNKKAALKRV